MMEIILALCIGLGSAAAYLNDSKPCEKTHCEEEKKDETKIPSE